LGEMQGGGVRNEIFLHALPHSLITFLDKIITDRALPRHFANG
jgi:hypothetical protein